MRLWSEERRGGTLENLMTYPVTTTALVMGKYFAAWSVVSLALLATWGLPLSVASLGNLDWGPVLGGYLGRVACSPAPCWPLPFGCRPSRNINSWPS